MNSTYRSIQRSEPAPDLGMGPLWTTPESEQILSLKGGSKQGEDSIPLKPTAILEWIESDLRKNSNIFLIYPIFYLLQSMISERTLPYFYYIPIVYLAQNAGQSCPSCSPKGFRMADPKRDAYIPLVVLAWAAVQELNLGDHNIWICSK